MFSTMKMKARVFVFPKGVELRIGTTYDDPKVFDDTPLQDAKYDERCRQIAIETFYVFSKL